MHPPLVIEKHPICKELIDALNACHRDHSIAKWWGACNDPKFALTKCFAAEKKIVRAERQKKAAEKYKQGLQAYEQRVQAKADAAAAAATAAAADATSSNATA